MKKTSLLLLTAVTAAMLSSCGTSTCYVSNLEDGIYYRSDSGTREAGWQEDRRISELKSKTASETGYARTSHKSDTIVISKGQPATEIDYLPGKSYTVLLDGDGGATTISDTLKNRYSININLNSYGYPYSYCGDPYWHWGFGCSWCRFGYAWGPWHYGPWFYDPWFYDPWFRPWGPYYAWGHPYHPYYDPWYRPYGPAPYVPVYVDSRPVVRTHRAESDMGRSSYTGHGSRITQISTRGTSSTERRSGISIQDRNIRTSTSEIRQENPQTRTAGQGDAISQTRTARSEAAAAVRSGAAGTSGGNQQSYLSDRRTSYSNYRPASGNSERRQESVNSSGSDSRRGFTSESRSSGYSRSGSDAVRSSGRSVSGSNRSSDNSSRSSYESSQSQRSSYSSGSHSGGGFSGGGSFGGGGFSGGGGSRGGGGMRR